MRYVTSVKPCELQCGRVFGTRVDVSKSNHIAVLGVNRSFGNVEYRERISTSNAIYVQSPQLQVWIPIIAWLFKVKNAPYPSAQLTPSPFNMEK